MALVANLNADETAFRQKMDKVNEYMEARELPLQLRGEIREFVHNARRSKETNLAREPEILGEMSALLRSKVALSINDHFLKKMPFFVGSDPNFLMELALSMRLVCFAPLEEVVLEDEIGHEMYFIFRGAVEVCKNNVQVVVLGESQYFGEYGMLVWKCTWVGCSLLLLFHPRRNGHPEQGLCSYCHGPHIVLH